MYDQIPTGPTGEFPDGKLSEDDRGECRIAVGHQDGNVMIEFGIPMSWMAMSPDDARALAQSLITHAVRIDGVIPRIKIEL